MKIKKKYQGSLPENAILNTKSDSELNTYSCKYIDENKEIYSLEEQEIGKWVDGKPLYRKVINAKRSSGSDFIIDNSNIINAYGYIKADAGAKIPFNSTFYVSNGNDYMCHLWWASKTVSIMLPVGKTIFSDNAEIIIIAEYTKTTD